MLYHQEKWEGVLSLLEPLFDKIFALDDGLAAGICLLSFEGYLQKRQPAKCRKPLEFLENLLPSEERVKVDMDWEQSGVTSSSWNAEAPDEASSLEEWDDDMETSLLSFPCISKLNLKESETNSANGDAHYLSKTEDLIPLTAFYRARILLSLGNERAAIEVLRDLLNKIPGCLPALFLRTEIALIQRRFGEAAVWLNRCIRAPDGSPMRNALLSNLGAVHYRLGNINVACLCFSKALPMDASIHSDNQRRTLYNMGLVSLRQGAYERALSQFRQSATAMFSEPCLWIRMAECCLALSRLTSSPNEAKVRIERPAITTKALPSVIVLPTAASQQSEESSCHGDSMTPGALSRVCCR